MFKILNNCCFEPLDFEHCNLFGIWCFDGIVFSFKAVVLTFNI